MGDRSRLCSVWLGSETGILKGVSVSRKQAFNFCNTSHLSRDQEVRALCWGDPAESELLVGSVDGTVKTFSTEKGAFTESRRCGDPAEGCFTGLAALSGSALLTCGESGTVRVWREDSSEPVTELDAGKNVCRMRQSPVDQHKVATGGKENGLKIWDLERPEKSVFTAKNLRDDWLDLRRPHWVRDMAFIPDSDKVVTCTGYHQVHMFDPSSPQRRPVLEAEYGEYPLTTLSLPAAGNMVVVGNTHGQIAMLDLRKGLVRSCLKGLAGGVRWLQCHPSQPVVASCGLDRFLRIHSLEDRKLLHKVYLKSRLNCLLLASRDLEDGGGATEGEGVSQEVKEEEDEVWDTMEQVGEAEEKPKRKTTEEEEEPQKKSKKKRKKGQD
ncbi:WD repeat-containing protein 74 [Seriola lalandi dorsalis]|uniref:WD repeat-containing protein 74 n=1 Tax=Seriola lalandi dorsalis TaxID=1841481 RepID=A0A3B4WB78_SERLL|nr:WD repeat-containing protein 74 [Seriola lalandi dorsalis]XP_056231046.1 WD repeat-containing protein 74 [Seriola aureovittata]